MVRMREQRKKKTDLGRCGDEANRVTEARINALGVPYICFGVIKTPTDTKLYTVFQQRVL